MRRILIAALLFALPSIAQAADHNWTGFYVGANFGYGNARATVDFSEVGLPLISGSENLDGAVYGA